MQKKRQWMVVLLFCLFFSVGEGFALESGACCITPASLQCEYTSNPVGVCNAQPRLSWKLRSEMRDQMQSAYQIVVSEKKAIVLDRDLLWDSGQVQSDQSLNVRYGGPALVSGKTYYWKVRVWDADGNCSAYSDPAHFSMGLQDASDWGRSQWIGHRQEAAYFETVRQRREAEDRHSAGDASQFYMNSPVWELYSLEPKLDPAPLFRKTFQLKSGKKVQSAMLSICGLGYYELHLNQQTLNNGINPARSDYNQSLYYMTYDVSEYLQEGPNAIGVLLGNGWYHMITRGTFSESEASWSGQPKMRLKLEIQYADGSASTIFSDESWKTDASAVLWTDVRAGEVYDARLKQAWDRSGFDDRDWKNACSVPAPKGQLVSQTMPPVRTTRTIKPVSMEETSPGVYVYDMGQNFAGWTRLKVKGPAGTKVTVSMAEQPRGGEKFIPAETTRYQQYVYILKGTGETEVFEPHFTYYGFQYVQLKGFPGKPTLDSVEGCFVHTDLETVGQFSCSDPLLNQLQQNLWWTCLSLVHSYPQDCPHREKNGWGDFNALAAESLIRNFDSALFLEKWVRDCLDQFKQCGAVGNIIPVAGRQGPGDPAWSAAWAVCAWYNYLYYNDVKVLADNYPEWKKWIQNVRERQTDGDELIVGGIGDWVAPYSYGPYSPAGPEGPSILTTAYYYTIVDIVAKAANILGYADDAAEYQRWAESIRTHFNDAFYNEDRGYYETEMKVGFRQASQAFAINMGLTPPNRNAALGRLLLDDIYVRHDGHLDTGSLGTAHLLDMLAGLDLHDAAYTIVSQKTYPGWLHHIVDFGATTIWETWGKGESHNHSCFLNVGNYFYEGLAGIRIDPAQPAFKHVMIRPGLPEKLDSAKASYLSAYGPVRSAWEKKNGQVCLNVSIPANTTADISVPKDGMGEVQIVESGVTVWQGHRFKKAAGLHHAAEETDYVTFKAGSGDYQFVVKPASDVLAAGRNCDAAVSCDPPVISMEPGQTASFVIQVDNHESSAISRCSVTLDAQDRCELRKLSGKEITKIKRGGSLRCEFEVTVPASIGTCKVLFLSGHLKGRVKGKSFDRLFTVQVNVLKRLLVEAPQTLQIPADYRHPVDVVEVENFTDSPKAFTLECQLPKGWKSVQKLSYRAEVSSMLDFNNRPSRLNDNIINHSEMNRWHSHVSAYPPHIIDLFLEEPKEINHIMIHGASPTVYCKEIRLDYKDSQGWWQTAMSDTLSWKWINHLDVDVETDQLRLIILSSVDKINSDDPHFAQINELELLGEEAQDTVSVTQVIEPGRRQPISLYLSPGDTSSVLQNARLKVIVAGKTEWEGTVALMTMQEDESSENEDR